MCYNRNPFYFWKLENSTLQKINEQTDSINQLKINYNRDIDKIKADTEENNKDVIISFQTIFN